MNIIADYKEKLRFKNYKEFGKAIGVSGDWLLEISKKDEIKMVDVTTLKKVCNYLGMTIDELLGYKSVKSNYTQVEVRFINQECSDVGILIDELKEFSNKTDISIDGISMTEESKKIFKDSLNVVKILTKKDL